MTGNGSVYIKTYRYGISSQEHGKERRTSAPALERDTAGIFFVFPVQKKVTLTKTPVKEQIICSVDLGINTDAVCTIMRSDGTVLEEDS